jgi:hypothetical protein
MYDGLLIGNIPRNPIGLEITRPELERCMQLYPQVTDERLAGHGSLVHFNLRAIR